MFFSGWTPGQVGVFGSRSDRITAPRDRRSKVIWWVVIGVACFGVGVFIGAILVINFTGMSL